MLSLPALTNSLHTGACCKKKAILDARAEISYRNRTKNNMKYVSSLHFNHNFESGSDRQIWSS